MKYGAVVFFCTGNLGDDIQSYASSRFYPQIDYYVDREKIDTFYSAEGEQVAVIMAGWYTHSPLNWPPSPYIYPLEVSMHFVHHLEGNINNKKVNFLDNKASRDWFSLSNNDKGVGCRDSHTKKLLQNIGIEAWWSGCITLTLNKFPDVENHGHIICVDCAPEIVKKIQEKSNKTVIDITHKYNTVMSIDERFELVEEILKLYQGASLVVTPRLHAALPSSALETPVLLVSDEKTDYRFSDYQKYFSCATKEEILGDMLDYDYDNPKLNSDELKQIGNYLSQICTEFIDKCEKMETVKKIDFESFLDGVNRTSRLKQYIYEGQINEYTDNWSFKMEDPLILYANAMNDYKRGKYEIALFGFEESYNNMLVETIEFRWKPLSMYVKCLIKMNDKARAKLVLESVREEFKSLKEYDDLYFEL